ncbi:nucleotidyltransferase domain-containing protein [Kordia algicida OT-1]|uniref:Polymerase nucleotidyl transferase domain-containing protein n=1 Tax=Kordia algicida OT-1 TaxID=391587 RepID=A9DQD1_9FLAO|nr:nucleotidyltransferase domain-containing protein [Kordia algicida]EDP96627.1 hypothetical protein KAOT1_15728 [Kordia algicida OT-1]
MEKALEKFIARWKQKGIVRGILLTGSYAVGIQNENSDIDIRLVLDNTTTTSFKGLETIDGFSFSYIGRSKAVTLEKFNKQFFSHVKMEARIYNVGKILFDPYRDIATLQQIAKNYVETGLIPRKTSETDRQLHMYSLHKKYEYILNTTPDDPFYTYNYILYLKNALNFYASVLNTEIIFENDSKLHRFLTDKHYLEMYGYTSFPDQEFIKLWLLALEKREIKEIREIYTYLRKNLYKFNESSTLIEWSN